MKAPLLTRREVLELMGMTAAAAALPELTAAQSAPTFPKGAIIRTLLKDYAPEELAGGATLFHEHMSLATDFNAKFSAATAATRALNGPPAAPRGGGAPGAAGAAGAAGALGAAGAAGARGARAGGGPPQPPGPDPMRDVNLMAEEL